MPKSGLPIKIDDLGLTLKQQRFVLEYAVNGFDATAAAKSSGLLPKDAPTVKSRTFCLQLLNDKNISTAIQRFVEDTISPYRDRMMAEMIAVLNTRAYYDVNWFFLPDGTARPLDTIPAERRVAIDEVKEAYAGKSAEVRILTYTLANRDAARKELRSLLEKKDDEGNADSGKGMRGELDRIFSSIKKGIDLGRKMERELQDEVVEPAQEQKTTLSARALIAKYKEK